MYKEITVLNDSSEANFTENVNRLLSLGWVILSTDIGFVNSESYDFCSSCQAILGLPK